MFRMLFPKYVKRGYHCPPVQQPYWNTIRLSDFPDNILLDMIVIAYDTVFNSFSKKCRNRFLKIMKNKTFKFLTKKVAVIFWG